MSQEPQASRRTRLAAERTWLAWWRTGIAIAAATIAIGGVAPRLVGSGRTAYTVLGIAYGLLAIAIFIAGYRRYRHTISALRQGDYNELPSVWTGIFVVWGVGLALASVVLILVWS